MSKQAYEARIRRRLRKIMPLLCTDATVENAILMQQPPARISGKKVAISRPGKRIRAKLS